MEDKKNILMIGANGRIGRRVVERSIKQCFTHCLVKSAPTFGINSIFLRFVDGDALVEENLLEALEGKDAVISCYGTKGEQPNAISDFTALLIKSMKQKVCL